MFGASEAEKSRYTAGSVSHEQFDREVKSMGEYYALIVAMVIGMIMMSWKRF